MNHSDNPLISTAKKICLTAHKMQFDKGGNPYYLHPFRVANACSTKDEIIVALLHDVVEDTSTTLSDLAKIFSSTIIMALDAITKRIDESYDEFIHRCSMNPISRNVKLHDLEDNMDLSRIKAPTLKDFERQQKYKRAYEFLIKKV